MKRVIISSDNSVQIIGANEADIDHVYVLVQDSKYFILMPNTNDDDSILKYSWRMLNTSASLNIGLGMNPNLPFVVTIREAVRGGDPIYEFNTPKELFTWLGEQL